MVINKKGKWIVIITLFALTILTFAVTSHATNSSTAFIPHKAYQLTGSGSSNGSDDVSGAGTVMPDQFTGTMAYSIPIDVAPGRNGVLTTSL